MGPEALGLSSLRREDAKGPSEFSSSHATVGLREAVTALLESWSSQATVGRKDDVTALSSHPTEGFTVSAVSPSRVIDDLSGGVTVAELVTANGDVGGMDLEQVVGRFLGLDAR